MSILGEVVPAKDNSSITVIQYHMVDGQKMATIKNYPPTFFLSALLSLKSEDLNHSNLTLLE